ncbi:MAG TPA: SurA N-terminal domain-containing protein [Nitrospirota bacterium]
MLESMRKHMTWMMWVIVGLITVTFLFFGIYPSDIGGRAIAKVGGDVITADEFNRAYRNMEENYRQLLKDQYNDKFASGLKSQALQELVVSRLFVQEANRIGLTVSDEELQASIVQMPAFARDGRFDRRIYEAVLDRVNMTPAAFEAGQRDYLVRQKLERLVRDGVMVTDSELTAAYQQQNPKAKPGDFEKNREAFRQTYLAGKQRDALTVYIRTIQDKTKITINDKAMAL